MKDFSRKKEFPWRENLTRIEENLTRIEEIFAFQSLCETNLCFLHPKCVPDHRFYKCIDFALLIQVILQ